MTISGFLTCDTRLWEDFWWQSLVHLWIINRYSSLLQHFPNRKTQPIVLDKKFQSYRYCRTFWPHYLTNQPAFSWRCGSIEWKGTFPTCDAVANWLQHPRLFLLRLPYWMSAQHFTFCEHWPSERIDILMAQYSGNHWSSEGHKMWSTFNTGREIPCDIWSISGRVGQQIVHNQK